MRRSNQNLSNQQNLYTNITKITVRTTNAEKSVKNFIATGDIDNITNYAKHAFGNDEHQRIAFKSISAAFVVKFMELHTIQKNTKKRLHEKTFLEGLHTVCDQKQLIGFLSGAGGTGKSKVINSVIDYCKKLCTYYMVPFTKRTIVVTAMTGSAAVSIFGETAHSAFCLMRTITAKDIEEWRDTLMVIVDEISFANISVLEKINTKLNQLKERPANDKFGDLAVLFAGDFCQLEPVKGKPLYFKTENNGKPYI